jgi:ketopantoate reductase
MSRDLAAGQPTEAEPILVDLTRRGAELGTKTPLPDLATIHLRVYNNRLRPAR